METLIQYLEEIPLGVIDDPHSDSRVALTETVTVCPECRSLHTLRVDDNRVHCAMCDWDDQPRPRRRPRRMA
jgi:hypothetical protein